MPLSTLAISTADGVCPAVLAKPGDVGPWPGVIFFMDGIGYRPLLEAMAQRLADHGYAVLLPDVFYRHRPYQALDLSRPPTAEERAERMAMIASATAAAALQPDVSAFLAALEADHDVKRGAYGATGYCMGGRLALAAAGYFPERFGAAAAFHAGGLATDDPESPHTLAGAIRAKVLVAAAEHDPFFDEAQKARLIDAFAKAGTDARVETWPARHGWTMTDAPVYDPVQAERHWRELPSLLAPTLGG